MTDIRTDATRLTGSEAAAILLMMLGEQEAAQILSQLEPEDIVRLGGAMFDVADVSEGEVAEVFGEFAWRARERTTIGVGAQPRIRSAMRQALGERRAESMLARIAPPAVVARVESARWMDARGIAAGMAGEHPQVIALLLAHLDPAVAGEVLERLPAAAQPDIVYRLATLESVGPEALADLDALLSEGPARMPAGGAEARGGASEAAKIMTNTRGGADKRIIRALARLDRALAARIEEEMVVFDDLATLDDKGLGAVLRGVDNAVLVVALKGAAEGLRERMLGCMSSRAADSLRDEMAERGPLPLAEAQGAQREIVAVARALAEQGAIMLGGGGEDYV